MDEQQPKNEAADGRSALTAVLGDLADQFECHALSMGIDDIEAAGRAIRIAKAEIERLRNELNWIAEAVYSAPEVLRQVAHDALTVPNASGKGRA